MARGPDTLLKNLIWRLTFRRSDARVIFVVGAPRSGTTLMKTILLAHSDVTGVMWETTGILGFENLFCQSNWTNKVFSKEDVQGLLAESRCIVDFYERYVCRYCANFGTPYFVDKLWPHNGRLKFAFRRFPNAHFVHIFRDGRDCYCSARSNRQIPQGRSLRSYASLWSRSMRACADLSQSSRMVGVRYEELVTEPPRVVKSIMHTLGLPFEPSQVKPHGYSETTYLSSLSLHGKLDKPISADSVGKYRGQMTDEAIRRFEKLAGDELRRYGYGVAHR